MLIEKEKQRKTGNLGLLTSCVMEGKRFFALFDNSDPLRRLENTSFCI